jgi:3-deoxy-D-manno-octulosonic-acid transferase
MAAFLKESDIFDRISQPGGAFTVKQAEALRTVFIATLDNIEAIEEDVADHESRIATLEDA